MVVLRSRQTVALLSKPINNNYNIAISKFDRLQSVLIYNNILYDYSSNLAKLIEAIANWGFVKNYSIFSLLTEIE